MPIEINELHVRINVSQGTSEYSEERPATKNHVDQQMMIQTCIEKVLEILSFDAAEMSGTRVSINRKYVDERLKVFIKKHEDLARYIL